MPTSQPRSWSVPLGAYLQGLEKGHLPQKIVALPLYGTLLQPEPNLSPCYYHQQYVVGSTAIWLWVFETHTLLPSSSSLLQGQPGVSRRGPCPDGILISPRTENPHQLCASAQSPSH